MSVYKSRRKDASAQFIADARELRRMTARAVKRFPSSYRYIVTTRSARTLLAWPGSLVGTKPQLQTGAAGRASPVSLADVTQLH